MKKLALKNAIIATDGGFKKCNVFVKNGLIERISVGSSFSYKGYNILDLKSLYLFPGLIDSHTHFNLKIEKNKFNSDDFISGSKACLSGGITTYIDFTDGDYKDVEKDLNERLTQIKDSYADYSFHFVLKNIKTPLEAQKRIEKIAKIGAKSIKIFTAYKLRGLMSDEFIISAILENAKRFGIVVCVHAESEDLISYNLVKYGKNAKSIKFHPIIRDEFTENYAIFKLLKLNEKFRAKIYFVHISSARSFEIIKEYKERGYEIFAETSPHYFVFNDSIYKKKDSYLFTFTPPLRDESNRLKMLKLLKYFDTVATDSCAFMSKDKEKFKNDLTKIPMGIASSQLLVSLLYTYVVKPGYISTYKMLELISKNPAKIFGIYGKGEIKKGFWADFCVFNPDEKFKVKAKNLYHKCDYSVYEGFELYGKVKMSILRGEIVYNNSSFLKPSGMYLKAKN
ncbi:MAG: amidohydrolase family protein [Elusimicrobiota bacterium]